MTGGGVGFFFLFSLSKACSSRTKRADMVEDSNTGSSWAFTLLCLASSSRIQLVKPCNCTTCHPSHTTLLFAISSPAGNAACAESAFSQIIYEPQCCALLYEESCQTELNVTSFTPTRVQSGPNFKSAPQHKCCLIASSLRFYCARIKCNTRADHQNA